MKITKGTARKYGGWSWDEIVDGLKARGHTLKSFEETNGLRPRTMSQSRYRRYPNVDRALAIFFNRHVSDIFPHRYTVDGVPIRGASRAPIPLTNELIETLNGQAKRRNVRTAVDALCLLEPTAVDFTFGPLPKNLLEGMNR